MPLPSENADTLLRGLSDFWLKYFQDVGDLKALYQGAGTLFGQAYLNLLSDTLNSAVVDAPLFKREYYRLVTVRSDKTMPSDTGYAYQLDTSFGELPNLQNKLLGATEYLEEGLDYTISGDVITFTTDIFSNLDAHRFAWRALSSDVKILTCWAVDSRVDEFDLYYRFGHFFSDKRASSEIYRTFIRGIMQLYLMGPAIERVESALNVVASLPVIRENTETVVSVDLGDDGPSGTGLLGDKLLLVNGGGMTPSLVGSFLTVTTTDVQRDIQTYPIIGVRADGLVLYLGPPIGHTGSWSGFLLPPPVSHGHGFLGGPAQIAQQPCSWSISSTGYKTITTDKNVYTIPILIPLRAEVVPGHSFTAFEPLADVIQVTDYISDPEWWHHITIPERLLPELPYENRIVSPEMAHGVIGYSDDTGYARVGDPGWIIGDTNRRRAAFIYVDQFLKAHLFGLSIDQRIEFSGVLVNDVAKLLQDAKPTHTYGYFEASLTMSDSVTLQEWLVTDGHWLSVGAAGLAETLAMRLGDWRVGDDIPVGAYFACTLGGPYTRPSVTVVPGASSQQLLVGGPNLAAPDIDASLRDDLFIRVH